MNPYIRNERLKDFPGPIAELGMHNPAVRQIMELYARGEIVTKEEALSQMVLTLAKDWQQVQQRAFELMALSTFPTIAPS